MADVFLSYAADDTAFADRIAKALAEDGTSVWKDKDSIQPGDRWIDELSRAIQDANVFIPLISKNYARSNFLNSEIAAAVAAQSSDPKRKIIPILIERGAHPPSFIDQFQYVDLSQDKDFETGVSRLKDAISRERPGSTSSPIDIGAITAGRDIQILDLKAQQEEFDRQQKYKNLHIRYTSFISLVATMTGIIVASIVIFYSPEEPKGLTSVLLTVLPALTGLFGTIIGYYFGSRSVENTDKSGEEVTK